MKIAQGFKKFQSDVFPQMEGAFKELGSGQAPETLFITCSDSRIDPHLITQSHPGELFIIRNAGNIVPPPGAGELSVEATIQYAVDVLRVKQIVVCGHSHCGAVTGLMNLESLDAMPVVRDWIRRSERVLERVPNEEGNIPAAIDANVLLQLEHLQLHSCVANAIKEGRLSLHGWVYHFESGQIEFLTDDATTRV